MAATGSYRTASGKSAVQMIAALGDRAADALGAELYQEAQGIIEQSAELVPVDTGTLRASRYVSEPVRQGDTVHVELGYGGAAAKINPKTGESADGYAVFVHENLEAHHPVGEALYLQQPFDWAKTGMGARIAEGMKGRLFRAYSGAMASAMGEG